MLRVLLLKKFFLMYCPMSDRITEGIRERRKPWRPLAFNPLLWRRRWNTISIQITATKMRNMNTCRQIFISFWHPFCWIALSRNTIWEVIMIMQNIAENMNASDDRTCGGYMMSRTAIGMKATMTEYRNSGRFTSARRCTTMKLHLRGNRPCCFCLKTNTATEITTAKRMKAVITIFVLNTTLLLVVPNVG